MRPIELTEIYSPYTAMYKQILAQAEADQSSDLRIDLRASEAKKLTGWQIGLKLLTLKLSAAR